MCKKSVYRCLTYAYSQPWNISWAHQRIPSERVKKNNWIQNDLIINNICNFPLDHCPKRLWLMQRTPLLQEQLSATSKSSWKKNMMLRWGAKLLHNVKQSAKGGSEDKWKATFKLLKKISKLKGSIVKVIKDKEGIISFIYIQLKS